VKSLARLSLNQATTRQWSVREAIEGCARAGVPGIGLWREAVAEVGVGTTAGLIRNAGLRVTSLCRGGFFTSLDAHAENRQAVEEAAALGADVLVLVSGGLPHRSRDLDGARVQIQEGIAELVPYAHDHNVLLGIEPLHPMFCSDRCAVVTLDQAIDLAAPFPDVGVVVDTYNVWWDPQVYPAVARARGRITAFQISDWVTPLPADLLHSRAVPGDGCIDLRRLRAAVDATEYDGAIEVEIFNSGLDRMPGADVLDLVIERYLKHVA
jgi:sugar phosphate isomerase/epimerase